MNINTELEKYINECIMRQYDSNDVGGHGREHILSVIERSFELAENFKLPVNLDMVYVVAAYHDIGYKENAKEHERVSSEKFLEDNEMKKFFNEDERKIIAEAIVDHRASLEYEARSIYGKLVSSADRAISVDTILERSVSYQTDKLKNENPKDMDIIENSYKKLSTKYGKEGYAKMYYPDEKYQKFLNEIQDLIANKDKFIDMELKIIKNKHKVKNEDDNKES